jgi:TonB-linked SusC/RagA family outer membrane protein
MIRERFFTAVLAVVLLFTAFPVHAQKGITLNLKEASLETFFQELRKQAGVNFTYTDRQASSLQPLTIAVKQETVDNVMKQVLKGSAYTYKFNNGLVTIVNAGKQEVPHTTSEAADSVLPMVVVNGRVFDTKKAPVPKASIRLEGSSIATIAATDGRFTIRIPGGKGYLIITSLGFKPKKVLSTGAPLLITLEEQMGNLDEAVVVAYGTTTKREQTGAVSVVKGKELEGIPSTNISNLLQGRVAGMDVTNMSGSPGGGGTAIVIRGYNSLDVEQGRRYSNPLWIVDGVPLNSFTSPVTGTNQLSDINPDMIESIEVLKDASAAALYGSRAANGVIIVTTKKGKQNQKATFSLNVSQTVSILPRLPDVTIGKEERLFRLEAIKNTFTAYRDPVTNFFKYPTSREEVYKYGGSMDGFWQPATNDYANGMGIYQDSLNGFYNNASNYFPLFFEQGKVTNANLQAYGGGEKMNYGIGLGYYNEAGILKGTGFSRVDFNTSLQVQPVTRARLDARLNISSTTRKRGTPSQSGKLKSAPLIETIPGDPMELSSLYPGEGSAVWDKVREQLEGTKEKNRSMRMRANVKVSYALLKGLEVSSSGAMDYSLERRNYFTPSYLDLSKKGRNTSLGEQGINLMVLNENLLTYKVALGEHHLSMLAGQSYQYDQWEYNGGSAMNTPSDKVWYASTQLPQYTIDRYGTTSTVIPLQRYMSDMTEKVLYSWFGRVEYNYGQRYLLSAAFRRDGSSVFGQNNKWASFPTVAAAYNFSEDLKWKPLNFGKFRTSWGRSGLQFNQPYLAQGVLNPQGAFEGNSTLAPDWAQGLWNQSLSWEQTDQYDVGMDLDFFQSRLSVVVDYYNRYTDRLLDLVPLTGIHNGYTAQWRNAAAISNQGLELLVKYEVIRRPALFWKVTLNAARNWNRFAKSYDGTDVAIYSIAGKIGRVVGKPLNGVWALQTNGLIQQQQEVPFYYNSQGQGTYLGEAYYLQPGNKGLVDLDGSGRIGDEDYYNVGSALPTMYGGLGSELRYKNFDMQLLFSFQIGRHIMNLLPGTSLHTAQSDKELVHPLLVDMSKLSFWKQPGDQADWGLNQMNLASLNPGYIGRYDDFVQKVNWVRFKTLVLGYNWSSKALEKAGLSQLRFFASGENLFSINNYSGLDPEIVDISNGLDFGRNYPLARRLTLGVTMKF